MNGGVGYVAVGCCGIYIELGVKKSRIRNVTPKRNQGNKADV
jgi:hypothetical protein